LEFLITKKKCNKTMKNLRQKLRKYVLIIIETDKKNTKL